MAELGLIGRIFGRRGAGERRRHPRTEMPHDLHLLVVDDSATIRAVLAKMLTQNGHVVITADDGKAALELARDAQPDLVFLDIVMPTMSGFEVLRALRHDERTQAIPVIMISGNQQATEQFYVQRFGADDFMKKPFGRGEVFARMEHLAGAGRLVAATRAPGAWTHLLTNAPHIGLPAADPTGAAAPDGPRDGA